MDLYSRAARIIRDLPQQKGTAEQLKAMALKAGAKPVEFEHAGFDKKFSGPTTKDELAEHLEKSKPQVVEKVFTDKGPPAHQMDLLNALEERKRKLLYSDMSSMPPEEFRRTNDEIDALAKQIVQLKSTFPAGEPKYEKYTTPGGDNYREMVLQLKRGPEGVVTVGDYKAALRQALIDEVGDQAHTSAYFRDMMEKPLEYMPDRLLKKARENLGLQPGSFSRKPYVDLSDDYDAMFVPAQHENKHWPQKDVIAHIRMKDRTDEYGQKVLHVEELQSDWAQEGRQQGFSGADTDEWKQWSKAAQEKLDAVRAAKDANKQLREAKINMMERLVGPAPQDSDYKSLVDYNNAYDKWSASFEDALRTNPELRDVLDKHTSATRQLGQAQKDLEEHHKNEPERTGRVPVHPYVTDTGSWLELALKRIAQEAVQGGYDKVIFTPGQAQADRYSLEKQVRGIAWSPETQHLSAKTINGGEMFNRVVPKEKLPQYVGKELSERLLATEPQMFPGETTAYHSLTGDDLRVGGTGMKTFYDKVLPATANKLFGKQGARVEPFGHQEDHPLDYTSGDRYHVMNVTPEMKQQYAGAVPAFAQGGEVGGWNEYAEGGAVTDYEPQRTVKGYKLFRIKRSQPGKLFPLFVNPNKEVPVGQWLEAEEGPQGKKQGKVKSRLGDLAYRPGWHAGDLPIATHIGGKSDNKLKAPDYRPPDQVWAEIEMPADVDWQSIANSRMQFTKDGEPRVDTAHITDQIPFKGFYRYKTNPNMTGNWLIGGHVKVNRILSDDEVQAINAAAGTADLPRLEPSHAESWDKFAQGGEVFSPIQGVEAYHEDPAFQEWFGNSVTHREGVPVTYYTGTSKDTDFNKFNVGRHGSWFTADPSEASEYAFQNDSQGYKYEGQRFIKTNTASRVIPAHLKIENPYTGPIPPEFFKDNYKAAQSKFFDILRSKGHDGWIPAEHGGKLAVVLKEPHQIKTVYNRTWDAKNPRMDKAGGGEVEDEGITAYHGSPHDFYQFDLSKIGTGEGAQAYGHGLYFAEAEPVAKGYRDALTDPESVPLHFEGQPLNTPWNDEIRERWPHHFEGKSEDHQDAMEEILGNLSQINNLRDVKNVLSSVSPQARRLYNTVVSKSITKPDLGQGHIYEVRINAHPDHFIDWDVPLADQSEHVKTAFVKAMAGDNSTLSELLDTSPEGMQIMGLFPKSHGSQAYTTFASEFKTPGEATQALLNAGIRGIKYLDRGSRGVGSGTRNYVVFDDKLVNVKRKYADGGVVKED